VQAPLPAGATPLSPSNRRVTPGPQAAPSPARAEAEAARADAARVVSADFLAGAGPGSALPAPVRAEIAFAGRSNVGKSSLINTLVQRKNLVRTGSTPGLTRQVNLYEAKAADGTVLHFVDLPGYGFAKRSKAETAAWAKLIEGYLGQRVTLAAVVLIVDVRRGVEDDDRALIEFIDAARPSSRRPVEVLLVATKLDKLPSSQRKPALAKLRAASGRRVYGFSAESGEGREDLFRAIRRAALGELLPDAAAPGEAAPAEGAEGAPVDAAPPGAPPGPGAQTG
jgi:GTP-binding protein